MSTWTDVKKNKAIKTIFERISKGESLRDILSRDNQINELPEEKTFQDWLSRDNSLKTKYLELTRYNSN